MQSFDDPSFARYRAALEALDLPRFAARAPGTPLIVALEGPNGAGKTTLCEGLADSLRVPSCLGTDPGWLSQAFKMRMIRDADWFASAMFFLSGCFEQMRGLRSSGAPLVIMDRSIWSTLAVHAAESITRLEALLTMLRPIAAEIRVPDFTVVLEATLETCQGRSGQKQGSSRALDALTARHDFYRREGEFYRWLGRRIPTVTFLDVNTRTAAEVCAAALALVPGAARGRNDSSR
jgi:thymidylate kinase